MTRYALWLVPSDEASVDLRKTMYRLSQRYSTPLVEPHVTLLSGIEGIESEVRGGAKLFAERCGPVPLFLEAAAHSESYFRSVYVQVTLSSELLRAHDFAMESFPLTTAVEFAPHLSLAYGVDGVEDRERIVNEIGRSLSAAFVIERMHLYAASSAVPAVEWKVIQVYSLAR